MTVPYLDYRIADLDERAEYLAAVEQLMIEGDIILGRAVTEIEERIAAYSGTRFAVGVGSGTDAISLALQAVGGTTGPRPRHDAHGMERVLDLARRGGGRFGLRAPEQGPGPVNPFDCHGVLRRMRRA